MIRQNRCKIFTLVISLLLVCVLCFAAGGGRTGDELEESLIKETLLSAKQDKVYQETVEEWIQNAGIIDKLQTAENKTNLSLLDLVNIMTENK